MKKFLKRDNIFVLIIVITIFLLSSFLLKESLERTLFIIFTTTVWLSIYLYTKDLVLSTLLYIFIVLPFNITLQLPSTVEIFNSQITFPTPYVNGVFVNYLIPTVSILDTGILLLLLSVLVKKGTSFYWSILKSFKNGLSFFFVFLVIQNILLSNSLVIFNSLRFFFYILSILVLVKYYKKESLEKLILPASFIFLLNLIVQGILGILQFLRGSSLGLNFLGESQVVSGMQGSSFISLGGQLFLRAYGTFPHPNILAGFLILCILFGILSAKKIPGIGITTIILSLLLLPFTFSRVAIVLAFLILVLLLVRTISKLKSKENVFSITPLFMFERFQNLIKGGDNSFQDRVNLLKSSLEVVKENFLIGTGLGNYVRAMENYVPRTSGGILLLQPVHNIFLLLFAELGVFGFLLFFYILLYNGIKNVKRLTMFKIVVIISILAIGFWDHYLFSLPQGLIIFVTMYLLLVLDLKSLD